MRRNADAALQAGPWSVTNHRPDRVKAGPDDYYSEGPYWWPDPKNPNGPYIRKDGERNPNRCAEHAAKVLSVWFVDAQTRMNPNLEFGQAVRGISTGRGTGIIDTVSLIHVTQGASLLEQEGALDRGVAQGVRRWFADYLKAEQERRMRRVVRHPREIWLGKIVDHQNV